MTERTLQGHYSGFLSRALAFIIDGTLISLTVLTAYWLTSQLLLYFTRIRVGECVSGQRFDLFTTACFVSTWLLNIFAVGFPFIYLLFFWVLAGQTPGKRLVGIKIVRRDGSKVIFLVAIRRLLGYLACFLSLGIGFLWVLIDDRRLGWHDKIAGTCVVYAWEARQNEPFLERVKLRLNQQDKPNQG